MRFLYAAVGHAAALAVFYWWLGIGDDATWKIAMSALIALVWIAALAFFERWLFRGRSLDWRWALAFAIACGMAWALTHWKPKAAGVAPQLLSFALRFGLAWALLNFAWVQIGRKTVAPKAHHGLSSASGD